MNENIKNLVQKLANDPEALAKFNAAKDPEEAYKLACTMQNGFTKEEFMAAVDVFKASMHNGEELSDEDLNKVAGGSVSEDVLNSITGSLTAMAVGCLI